MRLYHGIARKNAKYASVRTRETIVAT